MGEPRQTEKKLPSEAAVEARCRTAARKGLVFFGTGVLIVLMLLAFTRFESYESLYDAEYVGSQTCCECHTVTYPRWLDSQHAKMARLAGPESVVGDFTNRSWTVPPEARLHLNDEQPVARMYIEGGDYFMALRDPETRQFVPFRVDYVVGYQYRQVYLTRQEGACSGACPCNDR